jgi:hypothetical protein
VLLRRGPTFYRERQQIRMLSSSMQTPWSRNCDDKSLGLTGLGGGLGYFLPGSLEEEMSRLFLSEPAPQTPSPPLSSAYNYSPPSPPSMSSMSMSMHGSMSSLGSMGLCSPTGQYQGMGLSSPTGQYQGFGMPPALNRRRLGSGDSGCGSYSSYSSADSMLSFEQQCQLDSFRQNGYDTDVDEIDQIILKSRPTRAEELLGLGTAYRQPQEAPDILTKEHLLALLSRGNRYIKKKNVGTKKSMVCVFCRNNGEAETIYQSHVLKDQTGRVMCPVLRAYTCPNCNAQGDNAHTLKYCPLSNGDTPNIRSLKTARTATGKKRLP